MISTEALDSVYSAAPPGTARRIALNDLQALWQKKAHDLEWRCLFTLPPWLNAWWSEFGHAEDAHVVLMEGAQGTIGLAPLRICGSRAALIGSPDLCDYQDLVAVPQRGIDLPEPLFNYLHKSGVARLTLNGVRKDSLIWTTLIPYAGQRGWKVVREPEDTAFEIVLPQTWESYLTRLKGKQRHELRRKLRRLHEAGKVGFHLLEAPAEVGRVLDDFITLFKAGRKDKAAFMTGSRARFFRKLALSLARHQIAKIGVLELSGKPVAMVICFDHRSTRYLYNSCYDPHFRPLSVGLMAKLFSIRDALDRGFLRYDLLKGAEAYKPRLGAVPQDLYRFAVSLPDTGS